MKKRALILCLAVLPVLVAVGAAVAAGAFDSPKNSTARFHDVDKAKEAGYTVTVFDKAGLSCIAQPGQGAMGIHLLDYLQFEDVVPVCEREGRWDFLFVAAPLRVRRGTGSPLNPIAVF